MLIDLHEQHRAHFLRPIFGDPCSLALKKFIDGRKPKVKPKPEMFRGNRMSYFFIDFLMGDYGVAMIFPSKKKLGFPKIGKQFKMVFPVGDNSIEYGPECIIFTDFSIECRHQSRNIIPIYNILFFLIVFHVRYLKISFSFVF